MDDSPTPPSTRAELVRRKLRANSRRDRLVSLVIASVVMMFLVFAVLELSKGYRGVNGVITEKRFVEAPEVQFTLGDGGLKRKDIEGSFYFVLHVPQEDKQYTLRVDKALYDSKAVGEAFYFVRPPEEAGTKQPE